MRKQTLVEATIVLAFCVLIGFSAYLAFPLRESSVVYHINDQGCFKELTKHFAGPAVKRSTFVRLDLQDPTLRNLKVGSEVRMKLFNDVDVTLVVDKINSNAIEVCYGHVKNDDMSWFFFTINTEKDFALATIDCTSGSFDIKPAGDGLHVILDIDESPN